MTKEREGSGLKKRLYACVTLVNEKKKIMSDRGDSPGKYSVSVQRQGERKTDN